MSWENELHGMWNRLLTQVIELEHTIDRTSSTLARRLLGERAVELRGRMARIDAQLAALAEGRQQ